MGCSQTKFTRTSKDKVVREPTEAEYIEKIFDYMTSDKDLTEPCVTTISDKLKKVSLYEVQASHVILREKYEKIMKSNAVDLFLIAVTDDNGNITYKRFKKYIAAMRLRPEHYKDLMERMKQIKLKQGRMKRAMKCRQNMNMFSSNFADDQVSVRLDSFVDVPALSLTNASAPESLNQMEKKQVTFDQDFS